jgi:putative addiction module component (TIGR02574 family)
LLGAASESGHSGQNAGLVGIETLGGSCGRPLRRALKYGWRPGSDDFWPLKWSKIDVVTIEIRAMSPLLKSIEEQARALAPEDRARLAESMLESLQPLSAEIEAAWAEEIEERVSAFDQGEMSSHTAEDVFAEARQTLR